MPLYGKIEYKEGFFYIIKSRIKFRDAYPISFLHNPLKTRLRFLNLIKTHVGTADRHLNIGLGLADYELFLSRLHLDLYSVEHPFAPTLKEPKTQQNAVASSTKVSLADIGHSPLPFENNFFDSISLLEVIEHLPVECVPFAISEMVRVLKIGGRIYLSTPNLASLENRLLLLCRGKLLFYLPQRDEQIFDHLREYTKAEIASFFARFKCKIIEEYFFTDSIVYRTDTSVSKVIQATLIKLLVHLNRNFHNAMLLVIEKA